MILADTNALIWFLEDDAALGPAARRMIDTALAEDMLAVSAFSFWEITFLIGRKRIDFDKTAIDFRQETMQLGVREIAVTGAICIAAVTLPDLHGDSADRIIVATALAHDATLLTADRQLLGWSGPLKRHDARR